MKILRSGSPKAVRKAVLCSLLLVGLTGPSHGQASFIGGSTPDRRPESAPVIDSGKHGGDWYQRALTGISTPYPNSLRFLEDQGNWFTPFTRPGMTGPYDVRRWHDGG